MRQVLALLLLVGLIGAYFWQIVAVVIAVMAIWTLHNEVRRRQERNASLIARADQQHTWALSGDPRGTFGDPLPPRL